MSATDFDQVIQDRFAGQQGWFCLGTIDGDPDLEKMKQEWYLLPRQRTELAERCAELAARGFNLYWAACLFGQRQRSYAAALPSHWLWQDDCPADMACTLLIQSSEHKYQALVKLDRPITARERQRLQVAWRDATPGADSCSGNAVQLGRMPGGYNRKRHAFFQVHVANQTNKFWSADRLLTKAPALVEKAYGVVTELDNTAVALHLANIDALLDSGRAKCIKPDSQSGRILAGGRVPIASSKLGRMDDSSSTQIAILAYGFYCRGFMDEEIAAVCMHFYQKWGVETRKGTAWCIDDISGRIAAAKDKTPGVVQSPTRYRQQAPGITIVSRPAASRARADRPTKFDPAMLFARYQAEPTLCAERRKARASALGISTATLDRLEDGLEAIGLIEIEAKPGMPGKVILLGGVINIGAPEVLSGQIEAHTPEAPIAQAESAQNVDRSPQCIGETHPPPEAPLPGGAGPWPAMWHAADVDQPVMVLGVLGVGPDGGIYVSIEGSCTGIPLAEIEFLKPAAPPATWCSRAELAEWTKEAFDAYPGRASIRKVLKHIEMLADGRRFNLATLKRLYAEELARRRYSKQDARELQKARTMGGDALRKKSRAIAGAAAQMHRKGDKRAPIWDRRAGIYALVEAERQQAEAERIQRIGYSLTEQAEMLDLVDQVRPERQKTGRAATRGRVPPNPAPAGAPAGSPYYVATLALAERLKQVQP